MQFNDSEFSEFCRYLSDNSGIILSSNKAYLVTTRIRPILDRRNISSLGDLLLQLRKGCSDLRQDVIDAMTTNETFWFRDAYPFDYIKSTLLPDWLKDQKTNEVKIWSAACSSGQEIYSLAITLKEFQEKNPNSVRKKVSIVGTDLSKRVLDQAKLGRYDNLSINRGLSPERLKKFFTQQDDGWHVDPELKKNTRFNSINLLKDFSSLGKFDMIFCRNVLIYFSQSVKTDILTRIHQRLKPGGVLCLGSPESLAGAAPLFTMVHCNPGIIYRAN